jgi:hypothetical protein
MEKRFVNTILMPTTSWLALIVSLVVTAQGCTQPADDPADLLITNARIFTAAGATIESVEEIAPERKSIAVLRR